MKLLILSLSILSLSAWAEIKPADAVKYVPGGTVVQTKKDEVKIQTPKGSVVEIEFKRNGALDDASGDMIESDIFAPGNGQMTLEEIASNLKEQGYQLKGDWSYDQSFMRDWYYEVDAIQNNQHLELTVDAKTGKVTKSEVDD